MSSHRIYFLNMFPIHHTAVVSIVITPLGLIYLPTGSLYLLTTFLWPPLPTMSLIFTVEQMWLKWTICQVSSCCDNKIGQSRWLKQQKFIFWLSWRLESQDQGVGRVGFSWDPLLGFSLPSSHVMASHHHVVFHLWGHHWHLSICPYFLFLLGQKSECVGIHSNGLILTQLPLWRSQLQSHSEVLTGDRNGGEWKNSARNRAEEPTFGCNRPVSAIPSQGFPVCSVNASGDLWV